MGIGTVLRRSVIAAAIVALAGCSGGGSAHVHAHHADRQRPSAGSSAPSVPAPSGPTTAPAVACPPATTTVHDSAGLSAALAAATPGAVLRLADGRYDGRFTARAKATAGAPIFLCGGARAVLDAGSVTGGYGLHLDGAAYWRLLGFTVEDAQKGVVADGAEHSAIEGLTVHDIGDEGIHLRASSSDNLVTGNTVYDTGRRRDKFGEGIYIGTARSNWCTYSDCKPDPSDRDRIIGNRIFATTAESVDIKEGTRSGVLAGNTFDGSSLTGADSWVDVKGNGWLIAHNSGTSSPQDGFQTHEIVKGMGDDNVFTGNTARVDGPGYGFHLAPARHNVVRCDNRAIGARAGLSSVHCAG